MIRLAEVFDRTSRWLWTSAAAFGVALAVVACRPAPTPTELDRDNPIRPLPAPPFGMEEFFQESRQQPDPARARLGRWLFYDTRLSADRTMSCSSCHRPEFAFSDRVAVATGIGGRRGRRKPPSLVNLAAHTVLPDSPADARGPTFFWDGRAASLEAQVLMPIADPAEMGLDHQAMTARLAAITGYRHYFQDAFGSAEITPERVAAALADYVRTRVSGNAPFDRWKWGGDVQAMSAQAKRGSEVFSFKGRCEMCHAGFNFSDGRFHNLGVGWDAATARFADEGRGGITGKLRDRGAFKTPALRDVAKRPPYMHDGSLATLRDVVEFYNRGGIPNPAHSGRVRPIGLSAEEVDALVAFLESLDGEGYHDRPPTHFPR